MKGSHSIVHTGLVATIFSARKHIALGGSTLHTTASSKDITSIRLKDLLLSIVMFWSHRVNLLWWFLYLNRDHNNPHQVRRQWPALPASCFPITSSHLSSKIPALSWPEWISRGPRSNLFYAIKTQLWRLLLCLYGIKAFRALRQLSKQYVVIMA